MLLCAASGTVFAADVDYTIEPGKRVGAISKKTALAALRAAYGEKKVKRADLPGVEGTTNKGAIIFGGTDREMHVIWDEGKVEKEVAYVDLVGKAWVIGDKLKVGATLEDVESVNGAAFKISGFEWDLGGFADFGKGKLAAKVMVRFTTTADNVSEDILGDRSVSSRDKKVKAAKPVVEKLSVFVE